VQVSGGNGGPAMTVGDGSFPALLGSPTALKWFMTHVHLSTSPGSITSPPTDPFPESDALSKDIASS
jgi:hypothetical protein